jgi:predicted DNA-binding transcriptional regulator AlpA
MKKPKAGAKRKMNPEDKPITVKQGSAMVTLGVRKIWRHVADGNFPKLPAVDRVIRSDGFPMMFENHHGPMVD